MSSYAEKQRANNIAMFDKAAPEGNAFVWISNQAAPFDDMLAVWEDAELITDAQRAATNDLRKQQTEKFLTEYRANARPMTGEELMEARNAFGPGETIVNVITGETTQL